MNLTQALSILLLASTSGIITEGFIHANSRRANIQNVPLTEHRPLSIAVQHQATISTSTRLYMSRDEDIKQDAEIERLKSLAASLRAEVAELEAEKAKELAMVAEKLFNEFDLNNDGEVSAKELKLGLEKKLKTELSDSRIEQLMEAFDASGDGKLQLEEFVSVDVFRNKLEALVREEKMLAKEAELKAKEEEELARIASMKMKLLNEEPPTVTDKLVSILPYLFPLLDGLQYGRALILDFEQAGGDGNPLVVALAALYTLYRSIPFSGFVAFFALNFLSADTRLNRLVRYNMQQAIYLDIALFFPGLISGLASIGLNFPTELFNDAVFIGLFTILNYCSISSLLGQEPDKIPFISNVVKDRMPTIDMFDDKGNFVPREFRGTQEDGDDDQENKKN